MNTAIWAGGQPVEINARVIKWDEPGGLSFYPQKKYIARNLSLDELQKTIKCLVFHHSVTYRSIDTYNVLVARGLSCNFLLDDDGTIHQCLDIKDAGLSQKTHNSLGPGIEISSMPQAWSDPQAYSPTNQKKHGVGPRDIVEEVIHRGHFKCFALNEAQHQALEKLAFGFKVLFPDLPAKFPRTADGSFDKNVIPDALNYHGFLNHYNIDKAKIDTMGLDLQRIEKYVSSYYCE